MSFPQKRITALIMAVFLSITGVMPGLPGMTLKAQAADQASLLSAARLATGYGENYDGFDFSEYLSFTMGQIVPESGTLSRGMNFSRVNKKENLVSINYHYTSVPFFAVDGTLDEGRDYQSWKNSNIRAYLNNQKFDGLDANGNPVPNAATKDYTDTGFLSNFSDVELQALRPISVTTTVNGVAEKTEDLIFIPNMVSAARYNKFKAAPDDSVFIDTASVDYTDWEISSNLSPAEGFTKTKQWSRTGASSTEVYALDNYGKETTADVSMELGLYPIFDMDLDRILFLHSVSYTTPIAELGEIAQDNVYYRSNGKLTLVDDNLKITSLTDQTTGKPIQESISLENGTQSLQLTASASGHEHLTYKIVGYSPKLQKRQVYRYGLGTKDSVEIIAKDAEGNPLDPGEYTVYVWAGITHEGFSNAGSQPIRFTLNVGDGPIKELPGPDPDEDERVQLPKGTGKGEPWDGVDYDTILSRNNLIYYGATEHIVHVSSGNANYLKYQAPIGWRVMGKESSNKRGYTLLSDMILYEEAFFPGYWDFGGPNVNIWETANLRAWLNNGHFEAVDAFGNRVENVSPADHSDTGFMSRFKQTELDNVLLSHVTTNVYSLKDGSSPDIQANSTYDHFYIPWGRMENGVPAIYWSSKDNRESISKYYAVDTPYHLGWYHVLYEGLIYIFLKKSG